LSFIILVIKPLYLLLLFLAIVVIESSGNNILPLIDRDEPRFAEATREMRQSGDFIIPRVNGEYRFDKPPLIYWCQCASTVLLGESDFSVRFPSVLFAAATAVLTGLWGARLYGPSVGLWSGIIFGTCFQLFIHGRAAVADMPMLFFFLASTWIAWERMKYPESRWLWFAFYLSLSFGFLAKGPIALLPASFPAIFFLSQKKRLTLHGGSICLGILVFLLVVGSWGIPALIETRGEFFVVGIGKHVVMRSVTPMQSHGGSGWIGYVLSLPFYAVSIFFSFFPWSVFLPAVMLRLRRGVDLSERYMLGGAGAVFIVFTLIQTKLPHYILPAFPLLAILTARSLNLEKPPRWLAIATAACYLVIAFAGFSFVAPHFPSRQCYERAKNYLNVETRVASVGFDEPSLVWYFRYTVKPFLVQLSPREVKGFMAQTPSPVCVLTRDNWRQVPADPSWQQTEVRGFDFARWKIRRVGPILLPSPEPIDLVLIRRNDK
jgi:4-amino-4-deoxy-L-arabinose transferase-like glycosyltransferase